MNTVRPPERRSFSVSRNTVKDEEPSVERLHKHLEAVERRAKSHDAQAVYDAAPETFVRSWLLHVMAREKLRSAAQLAKLAGVAPSTITRAVDPECPIVPSGRTLAKVAQTFRTPLFC